MLMEPWDISLSTPPPLTPAVQQFIMNLGLGLRHATWLDQNIVIINNDRKSGVSCETICLRL